jgi:phosphatidylglycerophosphatase A
MTPAAATRLCSCFGLGRLGRAPGTVASAAAVALGVPVLWVLGPVWLVTLSCAALALGWQACKHLPNADEDPGWVVIDEVAGQWLALAFAPLTLWGSLAAFGLFRLFDIWKPWPVSWADQRLEGAASIMLDDMLAGCYAALILVGLGGVL